MTFLLRTLCVIALTLVLAPSAAYPAEGLGGPDVAPAEMPPEAEPPDTPAQVATPTEAEPEPPIPLRRPRMSKEALIKLCSPSAVDVEVIVPRPDGPYAARGAGIILHESGYILTASHVVVGLQGTSETVRLHDGTTRPFRRVAFATDYDIGILKIDTAKPLPRARIGRSTTTRAGDRVLIIGNPHGRPHTVRTGVIRSPKGGGPGRFRVDGADVAPGDSGAPVYNRHGEMVGMVQIKNTVLPEVSYSVRIDHLRKGFAEDLMNERSRDFRIGMKVDTFGPATVTEIRPGSPAENAGLHVGDVIRRVGPMRIDDGIHYVLALLEADSPEPRRVTFERGGKTYTTSVTPATPPLRQPVEVADVEPGVRYAAYHGEWEALPDFHALEPVASGILPMFTLAPDLDRDDAFGLAFTGRVWAPADGKYTFHTTSDDGSKLWIGDELVVENDGVHPSAEKSGVVFLKAGLHPIRVTFFEAFGHEALRVSYSGPGIRKQVIPPSALFTQKP